MDKQKPHCVVVTCFDEHQPGFLDFSYRMSALAGEYQLSVISKKALNQPELMLSDASYYVINTGDGKLGWVRYLMKSVAMINKLNPAIVVLLHSALSPISVFVRNIPTCLYWNEHPTNLMHIPAHGYLKQWVTRLLHKLLFLGAKKARLVMPIGEDHQQDLMAQGVLAEKIRMIYMGVSDAFISSAPITTEHETRLRFIYVGTISEARGRDVMLTAMRLVADQHLDVTLTMLGADDVQLEYCEQRIKSLGLEQYIQVHGRVTGEKIPAYLRNADAAICVWQPSPWNQFNPPTKLFEYLVAGLPVLANNIPTHTRYVSDAENGFVYDYDANALANAIARLYQQRERLPILKQAAAISGQVHVWSRVEPIFMREINRVLNPS